MSFKKQFLNVFLSLCFLIVLFDESPSLLAESHADIYETVLDKSDAFSDFVIEEVQTPEFPFDPERADGSPLFLLMLLIIVSTFVSEDLTCVGTGLLIAKGIIGFYPGVLACLLGIFIGDILLYLAGRGLASTALHKAPLKWFITETDIQRSYQWFKAKGPAIIIVSRFIPGTRFPTYFTAGVIRADFRMFILYFGIASVIWTPILVGSSVLIGNQMIGYFEVYQEYAFWVVTGVILLLLLVFKVLIPGLTFKGRRLLYGKLKRILNWEFWPPYITYIPVMVYMCTLWIRHRSITLFTAANPGIPEGGFINESKSDILKEFSELFHLPGFFTFNASEETSFENVLKTMAKNKIEFPVVLKPDTGERGKGVQIIRSEAELNAEILDRTGKQIIQEFIDGEEYGIFYYRYPSEEHGKIFSITVKEPLFLKGDGKHTLEDLILKDERAVCMAEYHINHHIDALYSVPEEGELIKLVEIGTHSRGSVFKDGHHLITEELTKKIDEISKEFEGFYFGRYDLKVPDVKSLKEGKDLKIIELNGVTSESTNIYDPGNSFFKGIKILCQQWKIAYQIGAEVKRKDPGLKLPTLLHLFKKFS